MKHWMILAFAGAHREKAKTHIKTAFNFMTFRYGEREKKLYPTKVWT